jgi:hypothetical protein
MRRGARQLVVWLIVAGLPAWAPTWAAAEDLGGKLKPGSEYKQQAPEREPPVAEGPAKQMEKSRRDPAAPQTIPPKPIPGKESPTTPAVEPDKQ